MNDPLNTANPTLYDIRDAELNEKANEAETAEIRLGYNDENWSIALEVYGRHRIVYPDGSSEVVNTKSSFCTCGQSRNKPFCDQTHQTIQMSNAFLNPWHIGFDLMILIIFIIYVRLARASNK